MHTHTHTHTHTRIHIKHSQAVELHGTSNWREVATHVGTRSSKQCSERWLNVCRKGINRGVSVHVREAKCSEPWLNVCRKGIERGVCVYVIEV
jgi:hypothetical protein